MQVASCKRCKRLFNQISNSPLCPECSKEVEASFLIVKEYLLDNPKHNIQQVSENTEVPMSLITQFLREGRIVLVKGSGLVCERCGAEINSGKLCPKCQSEITNTVNELTKIRKEEEEHLKEKTECKKARLHFKL